MITSEDIKKLAKLARVGIGENAIGSSRTPIGGASGYIYQIKNAAAVVPAPEKQAIRNVFRKDDVVNETGTRTADLIAEAPRSERNYVQVKKIL